MRFRLYLLAVLSISHLIFGQSATVPHDIHCNFQLSNGIYFCSLDDVVITTEAVPLRFFNDHLPDQNDSTVTGIDSWSMWPRNVSIRVLHPQLLQQFPNLQFVQLRDSQMESLPIGSFERCNETISIILDMNLLSAIPGRVFQRCNRLRTLDLSSNPLTQIESESFYGLENLLTLRFGGGNISNDALVHLRNLQELFLNNIVGLGSNALRHMSRLEAVDISDNSLRMNVIQDAIDGMNSLLGIALNRNGYANVNFTFFEQFEFLEGLQLIGNQLVSIPENSFRNFHSLVALRLQSNQIATLTTQSFAGLDKLDILQLNNNRLSNFPPNAFSELINLRTLDLSNNVIERIDVETFTGLQRLETLRLNDLPISELTPGIFEHLQSSLQILQIRNGRISSIPPNTFTAMENLRQLNLEGNQITRLNSNSFGPLPLLETFLISPSLFVGGINEIERNFFNNFPRLVRFGGNGNVCFDGIVDVPSVDFGDQTIFDQCFSNWDASLTPPTTTTEMTTTPSNGAIITDTPKLWLLVISILVMKSLL